MSDPRAKLQGEVLKARWDDLAPHYARGALLLAHGSVDLLDVAVAIANDDQQAVVGWLGDGLVGKPTDEVAQRWALADPPGWFQAVIVQPFVVAQPLP